MTENDLKMRLREYLIYGIEYYNPKQVEYPKSSRIKSDAYCIYQAGEDWYWIDDYKDRICRYPYIPPFSDISIGNGFYKEKDPSGNILEMRYDEHEFNIWLSKVDKFVRLSWDKPCVLKGVDRPETELYTQLSLSDYRLLGLYTSYDSVTYYKGADDVHRITYKNGDKLISSHDTGRALLIKKDGTTYISNPHYLWEQYHVRRNDLSEDYIPFSYGKGITSGRITQITHNRLWK